MKHFFKKNIFLLSILVIATFFRFYQLDQVPPSGSLDEVSIGWNAYSILKTGGDEYGVFPILLRAYDDFRPAMHVYFTIPFVAVLGPTIFAVRLPAVILSLLTVVATYFLTKELFPKFKQFSIFNTRFSIGEVTALLLAISPWHIYISRLGHEVNEGLTFAIFGLLFFLKRRINVSLIFFASSFMSYHPEKIFIPIIGASLFLLYRDELLKIKRRVFTACILALVLLVPFLLATFSPYGFARFSATNVFTANSERFYRQSVHLAEAVEKNDLFGKILYNRRIVAAQIFIEEYVSHFNPRWFFSNISLDRHKVPSLGLFYFWEAPLILVGFLALLFQSLKRRVKILIIFWILASPITAALTTDSPHAMRSYTMLPMFSMMSALGFISIGKTIKNAKPLLLILVGLVLFSLYTFYQNYFFVFPKTQSHSFQYALGEAISYVLAHEKNYDKIVFSNKGVLYQSYMFFLFYSRYDPLLYQKQGGTKSGGFAEAHAFGKYEFRPIEWDKEKRGTTLYAGNIVDFPENVGARITIEHLSGEDAIKIVE